MRLLYRFWIACAGTLVLAASGAAHAAVDLEQSLKSLHELAALHPNDPDYSWAVANALEAAGRDSDAALQMRAHLERWPDRPADGWRALGRCEYRSGRFEPARDALAQAIARDPRDSEARLYLGLALQALGERDRAEQHLEQAARLDPQLAGDALLLAGISHLSRGNTNQGRALLERVMEVSPHSNSAREARSLANRGAPEPRALRFEAYSGLAYDSNATLDGGSDLPGDSADDDFQAAFGTRLSWRPPLPGEGRPLELVGLYERIDYLDFDEFSTQRTGAVAAWRLPLHERAAFRISTGANAILLDDSLYLVSGQLTPQLFFDLGGRRGILRLQGGAELLEYDEQADPTSFERDGWLYGGGADHLLALGSERRAWITWGASYQRRDTQAQRDELGFGSAYDRDRWRALTRIQFQLPFAIRVHADARFDAELYDHRNLADHLSGASATTPAARRRDLVVSSTLSLRRQLLPSFELELFGGYEDRDSNVDVYRYQRGLGGMKLHAAFP